MQINFKTCEQEMEDLVRIYMVFGEEQFTFEEANAIVSFSPHLINFLRNREWLERFEENDDPVMWKLSFMGARMTEIYIEIKETDKNNTFIKNSEQKTLL